MVGACTLAFTRLYIDKTLSYRGPCCTNECDVCRRSIAVCVVKQWPSSKGERVGGTSQGVCRHIDEPPVDLQTTQRQVVIESQSTCMTCRQQISFVTDHWQCGPQGKAPGRLAPAANNPGTHYARPSQASTLTQLCEIILHICLYCSVRVWCPKSGCAHIWRNRMGGSSSIHGKTHQNKTDDGKNFHPHS